MELLQLDLIDLAEEMFYFSPMTREMFIAIPSMENVRLYENLELDGLYDYIVLYARSKISPHPLKYIEERDCYILEDVVDIQPDFYMKKLEDK